jgi:mono/diheme cytochrome c family protein
MGRQSVTDPPLVVGSTRQTSGTRNAAHGKVVFNGKANCASCHVPPLFTEPGGKVRA